MRIVSSTRDKYYFEHPNGEFYRYQGDKIIKLGPVQKQNAIGPRKNGYWQVFQLVRVRHLSGAGPSESVVKISEEAILDPRVIMYAAGRGARILEVIGAYSPEAVDSIRNLGYYFTRPMTITPRQLSVRFMFTGGRGYVDTRYSAPLEGRRLDNPWF